MLHELLLALSGTAGAIFKAKDHNNELEIVKELPFVHPSEIEQLKSICKLGSYFRHFTKFIRKHSVNLHSVRKFTNTAVCEKEQDNGLYIQAFSRGLEQVLEPYQQTLVKLEAEVLRDPKVPLSHIYCALEANHFLFPILSEILETVETKKVHGCQILDLIYKHCYCGISDVKDALEKILHTCHSVLFKQLSAWMLHGMLLDEYNEFFISTEPAKVDDTGSREVAQQVQSQRSVIIRGITGKELDKVRSEEESIDFEKDEISVAFLAPEMLPGYITTRLVEKILFIGQSVKMFKDTKQTHKMSSYDKVDILQGKEREFLKALKSLEEEPTLSVSRLETQVDKIKSCVAEQLWKLVVEDGELLKHLRNVKEIFLLGRGELFQTFMDRAQSILKAPPTASLSYDLNSAFERSLRQILLESDDYRSFVMALEIIGSDKEKNRQGDETNGWDSIFVRYEAPWPLHLLFTNSVIKKYNTIFRFLFGVKRTQLDLQGLWAMQMVRKRSGDNKGVGTTATWGLRRQMAFLVDNLQYYLQVDVLEAQFSELMKKVKETRDFESIQLAHERFLAKLHSQCFIAMKPVFNTLGEVLKICRVFSEVIAMNADKWTEREQLRSEELGRAFEQHSSLLFKFLSSVRSHQISPHLGQLLLRIDFNQFFSTSSSLARK